MAKTGEPHRGETYSYPIESPNPGTARHPDLRSAHREVIARAYLKGRLQAEIARELGISVSTLKRDLAEIRKKWLASTLRDFDALKAEQLAKLDVIEAEAWDMWSLNKQKSITRTGAVVEIPDRATAVPRYLQIALQCVERRAKLLGLDGNTKIDETAGNAQGRPDLRSKSSEELIADLNRLLRSRVDMMPEEKFSEMIEYISRGRFSINPAQEPK